MDFDRFSILQRFPVLVFEIGVRFARKMRSKFGRNLKNVIVVLLFQKKKKGYFYDANYIHAPVALLFQKKKMGIFVQLKRCTLLT
ncbi:unnamed protein product [Trifolium pratense]|uniref:Uncharacterized protein n=1 Tax=Trifolium pratense TaxID=57577 RepID=A0ACB0LR15_TRIPR|nr:unnamed protein product [Trifolium pratense]